MPVIAFNPFGPSAGGCCGGCGADPFSGGFPSMAAGRLDNPMANAAAMGGLGQMMAYNEQAYQGLLMQIISVLGGLMRSGGGSQPFNQPNSNGSSSDLGGSGGSSSNGSSAGGVDPSQFSGGTDTGRKLAAAAKAEATNGDSQGGWCYRDVGRALSKIGVSVSGGSAYMAADQLAKNPKVKEIKVSQGDLAKLPPGAIVVWDRGNGHEHGHISISTGDGQEASDIMRKQITNYGTSFRVFMPV